MEIVLDSVSEEIPEHELSFNNILSNKTQSEFSKWIKLESEQGVLLIWWLPTILGILLGEMSLLYVSITHIPQYLIYAYLSRVIPESRPNHDSHFHFSDENIGSPCLETIVVWSLTIFMFIHHILRNISKGRTITRVNLKSMGYVLLGLSIFVSWAVVYTDSNSIEQMLFGALIGCLIGSLSAMYLEYVWSYYIPYLMKLPPFSWFGYIDSVYGNNKNCKCKSKNCKHKMGKMVFNFVSNVYTASSDENFIDSSNSSSSI